MNTTDKYREIIYSTDTTKTLKLVDVTKDVDVTEYITSFKVSGDTDYSNDFGLGRTPSVQIEVEFANKNGVLNDYLNDEFLATLFVNFDEESELQTNAAVNIQTNNSIDIFADLGVHQNVKLGYFRCYDMEETYSEFMRVVMNDRMRSLGVNYVTELSYPTTVYEQLNEMSRISGVPLESFPNGFKTGKLVNSYDSYSTIREHIGWIAEMNGCNARINGDGKLEFVPFNTTVSDHDVQLDLLGDLLDKKNSYKISRVVWNELYEKGEESDTDYTLVLNSDNIYIEEQDVYDIYDMTRDVNINGVKDVYGRIDPSIQLFDIVSIIDSSGTSVYKFMTTSFEWTYVVGSTLGTINGEIANKPAEDVTDTSSAIRKVNALKVNVDRLNAEFSVVAQEVGTIKEDYVTEYEMQSSIEQRASGIEFNVSRIETEKIPEIEDRTTRLETCVSIQPEGVRISQGELGAYTLITDAGMDIYSNEGRVAYARNDGFYAIDYVMNGWHMVTANNKNSFCFIRKEYD